MKENAAPKAIRREEYRPPAFTVTSVSLDFDLQPSSTQVTSTLAIERMPGTASSAPLMLDGVELECVSVALDGVALDASAYELGDQQLIISQVPDVFALTTVCRINPAGNKALEGLYLSSGNFCTQCEAQGFRKITWYPDRPDILATFDVTIHADSANYPVLLANGNLQGTGQHTDGRHWARWQDPFPKPSYLFALVAGKLECIEEVFTTRSGRAVDLRIYVEPHNLHKCDYAMQSLINAMRWDEQAYRLEYDLDVFMIVAVDDFNMGAMENKGLNIFNSKYVLADRRSATDADFLGVESVIAHEYFHNWTGNRVTCRDWFQLSLKEGLTVFRDQQFSGDMNSHAVKRIEDVRLLRSHQFPEDAGPMAHPIRPDEYIEINNFYTVTVYEKGAEVIRMIHTLLGAERYRRGIELYFERHDGQAVTCDDFVDAMETASGVDLGQFRHWYAQAGTPQLDVEAEFDEEAQTYTLRVLQHCPATPGQPRKPAFHIPLRLALLSGSGDMLPLFSQGHSLAGDTEAVIDITEMQQTVTFANVSAAPVPSLLRSFSAPVHLNFAYSEADLAFLMAHDSDSFNRWDAGQRLARRVIEQLVGSTTSAAQAAYEQAYGSVLAQADSDPAFVAEAMQLPGIEAVAERHDVIAIDEIHLARQRLLQALAVSHREQLIQLHEQFATPVQHGGEGTQEADTTFAITAAAIGRRSLANACLRVLAADPDGDGIERATRQYQHAANMSDTIAALRVLVDTPSQQRDSCLADFYARWQHDKLVTDKWFSLQAMSIAEDTVTRVKSLLQHDAFTLANPNRVRSLIGAFAAGNPLRFHSRDGEGYGVLADIVLQLDPDNPQVAARLVNPLSRWRRFDTSRQEMMQAQLQRILGASGLSPDVYEIASKSLASS